MALKPRVTCYVTLPGSGETEFFPINSTAVYTWVREHDVWRKKIDTGLLIANHGGLNLYDIMASTELMECGCHTLPMRMTLKCPFEDETTLFTGTFVFVDGEWNFDQCRVEIEPRVEDPFTCFFKNWDTEKNILDIINTITLSTDFAPISEYEEIQCTATYVEDFPGSPNDRRNIYESGCLAAEPGGDWQVLIHEVSGTDPLSDLFVRTRWVREIFNGAGPPAGNGWTEVTPIFWTRPAILQGPSINELDLFYLALWTTQSKTLDNGRLLKDVLQFLVSDCPYEFQSDFLGIDPDGTSPVNDAYEHAKEWIWNLVAFSMADVVRSDASENSTKALVKLKDLLEGLKLFSQLFLFFDYTNNKYRIEHVSYNLYSRLINFVKTRPGAIRGYNSYKYDKIKIPKRENFGWAYETKSVDWNNASIIYSDCGDNSIKENTISAFHTDFGGLVGSQIEEIDTLDGLVLVSQKDGQISRGIGAISGLVVPNHALSWANMIVATWKWLRPECTGTVNGVENFQFASLMYKIRQTPFTTELGCSCKDILDIDPNIDKVRTGLGSGIIDDISIDLETGEASWIILHAPPITIIDEELIIPGFDILVNDDTQCYYTDFIFSLNVDLNDAINVEWDFGVDAVPATATGEGPHTVQYTSSGTKTITVTATYEDQEVIATLEVTVALCPGAITGNVSEIDAGGLGGWNVRLFNDVNANGVSDGGAPVKSVNTAVSGSYAMTGLTPGHYVIILTPASNFTVISAVDASPDGDVAPDLSTTDLVIPCTITPSKIDGGNNFSLQYNLGIVTGSVMLSPGGTPVSGATVRIYADANLDGVADDAISVGLGITNASGLFNIGAVPLGEYVLTLIIPAGHQMVSAQDDSPDGDNPADISPTDNVIPLTITFSKTDEDNNFLIELI